MGQGEWCILAMPQFLIQYLEPPLPQPGFWASNLIAVRSYTPKIVEKALRYLDEQGELIAASKLIEVSESEEEIEADKELL